MEHGSGAPRRQPSRRPKSLGMRPVDTDIWEAMEAEESHRRRGGQQQEPLSPATDDGFSDQDGDDADAPEFRRFLPAEFSRGPLDSHTVIEMVTGVGHSQASMDHDMTQQLLVSHNSLTEEVRNLNSRQAVLENKVRYAYDQFQHLSEKYVLAVTEISNTMSNLKAPPRHHSLRDDSNTKRGSYKRVGKFPSNRSRIPKSKRRGLLSQWTVIPEVRRPYDYSSTVKWTITVIVAVAAAAAPVGSSIFFPSLPEMALDFDTSSTVVNLTVALYMLSMAVFPLWWSAFSEHMGRRNIYIVSFTLSFIFTVISAVSVNIAMLIIFRVLSGGAAASVQAVGAGTIADIWEPKYRGKAMGIFFLGPLTGPLIAPLIGGILSEQYGWRSTMWFSAGYSVVILILILLCLPETLADKKRKRVMDASMQTPLRPDQLSRHASVRSVQINTTRGARLMQKFFIDPLSIVTFLRYPAVATTVYFAAISFGTLYVLNISLQAAFSKPPYEFAALIIGLLYIPNSLGYVLASVVGGRWIDHIMHRQAEKAGRYDAAGNLVYLPEDRLRENAWISASLYPLALIWYGWTVQYGLHWSIACVANFLFGLGSMLAFNAATTMLTEFMPKKSSNGVALNNLVRNVFSCLGAIVAQPLINILGHGWLLTILGLTGWITGNFCLFILRRNGPRWRQHMERRLNPPA